MTNTEWLRCRNPYALLEQFAGQLSDRKHRLFAAACCRRIWHLLPEAGRWTVEVVERHADGLASAMLLAANRTALSEAPTAAARGLLPAYEAAGPEAATAAWRTTAAVWKALAPGKHCSGAGAEAEQARQASLLRDLLGDPFLLAVFADSWRKATVMDVARDIYDRPDFASLPILGDALRDAGCENVEILSHCEAPHHARGCWLLDRILGMR